MKTCIRLIFALVLTTPACFADAPATSPSTTQASDLLEPTRVTLKLDNVPVGDAIAQLFKQGGLPPAVSPGAVRTIDQMKVTMSVENEPFASVLLELCRKTGMEPEALFEPQRPFMPPIAWRSSTRPSTRASTRPVATHPARPQANRRTPWVMGPSATAGPFVIVARGARRTSDQSLDQPGATLNRNLSLTFAMIGDPKLKLHAIDTRLLIDEAEDENGVSLAPPAPDGEQSWQRSMPQFVRNVFPINAQLTYPSEQSRRIALLRGHVNMSIVRKSDTVEIFSDNGARAGKFKAGAMNCSIRDLGEAGGALRLMMTVEGTGIDGAAWEEARSLTRPELFEFPDDAVGLFVVAANMQGRNNEGFQIMLIARPAMMSPRPGPQPLTKPKRIVWNVPMEVEDLAVPVEFKDLPLP